VEPAPPHLLAMGQLFNLDLGTYHSGHL